MRKKKEEKIVEEEQQKQGKSDKFINKIFEKDNNENINLIKIKKELFF